MSDPRGQGRWETVGLSGVLGTHAALMPDRSVLFFTRPEEPSHKLVDMDCGFPNDLDEPCEESGGCPRDVALGAVVRTDGADAFNPDPVRIEHNPFCAGAAFLPDGRLLIAGGDKKDVERFGRAPAGTLGGLAALRVYDFDGGCQTIGAIASGRWYPTCTTLPDGRVFILSGSLEDQQPYDNCNPTCETIPPMAAGPQLLPFLIDAWPQHSLPPTYVLPDGRLYVFAANRAHFLTEGTDAAGVTRWLIEPGAALAGAGRLYPNSSTSVLLPLLPKEEYRPETMLIGGGAVDRYPHWGNWNDPAFDDAATAGCHRLILDDPAATWRDTAPMSAPRIMGDAVLLPDRTVFVVNGAVSGYAGGNAADGVTQPENAVFAPEIYDPAADRWQTMRPAAQPRLYHASALLLPDATVLVAGSDQKVRRDRGPGDWVSRERDRYCAQSYDFTLERFIPPYLERGPRPAIEAVDERLRYGVRFAVTVSGIDDPATPLEAALVAPGAVTHGNNMSQRLIGLAIVAREGQRLTLEAPPRPEIAPPGPYMLFLLAGGVPSVAAMVRLPLPAPPPPGETEAPAGAQAWFSAERGVLADARGAVSSWIDVTGNGFDLTAHFTGHLDDANPPIRLMPSQLNGRPVLHFPVTISRDWINVVGRFMRSQRPLPASSGPYSIAIVARPWRPGHRIRGERLPDRTFRVGDCADLIGWGDFDRPDGNAYVALRLSTGPLVLNSENRPSDLPVHRGTASIHSYWRDEWLIGDQLLVPESALIKLGAGMLIEAVFDGARIALHCNGRELKSDPDTRNTRVGRIYLGRNGLGSGAYYRGDIAEVLIYDRALSPHERAQLHDYVNARYALW